MNMICSLVQKALECYR